MHSLKVELEFINKYFTLILLYLTNFGYWTKNEVLYFFLLRFTGQSKFPYLDFLFHLLIFLVLQLRTKINKTCFSYVRMRSCDDVIKIEYEVAITCSYDYARRYYVLTEWVSSRVLLRILYLRCNIKVPIKGSYFYGVFCRLLLVYNMHSLHMLFLLFYVCHVHQLLPLC